ncbi:phenylalanine--tRNA ligase subunit alpha [Patescibacteria group bacterium]
MAKIDLEKLKVEAQKEIKEAKNLKELDEVFKKYLGKRGKLTQVLRSLEKLPKTQRIKTGKASNELKSFFKKELEGKTNKIEAKNKEEARREKWIDVTVPSKKPVLGHLHPLTLIKRKAEEIFQAMGFSVVGGPEVETEWYNFDALNIPKDHPARDMWDTFWLKPRDENLLLRTHTSPVQIRYMEKNIPPLRIIVPGRVFRYEATDASHEINFYQLEGLMVDKLVSAANFKAVIEEFFKRFFAKEVKIRLRPSYFPFTEPSFEVDLTCLNCLGKGCSVCSRSGWLEIMGAGMVHPAVFKSAKINHKDWQGFAFGMGLDRLAMMKYKINDIRLFYSGDLRFLNQF